MARKKPIRISKELAAKYTNPDQAQRFDSAVSKIFSASRADVIRHQAFVATCEPRQRGRKPKSATAGLDKRTRA